MMNMVDASLEVSVRWKHDEQNGMNPEVIGKYIANIDEEKENHAIVSRCQAQNINS